MTNTHPRSQISSLFQMAALAVVIATVFGAWSSVSAQTTGYHDFSYGSVISAPTGSKPESKVWFNDGIWWAVMFNSALQGTDIYRLDSNTQTWSDTGTPVDDRAQSVGDALWDQASNHLYIVSNLHINSAAPNNTSSNWGRLYRYTYNSGTKVYALDAGYPVTVTKGKEETLTLAKDSTGKLWVTYVESSKVMYNHSNGSDNVWGTPAVLPVNATATATTSDDISSIIAFGGNKIGIFWSNQSTDRDYFAIHNDADPDTTWQAAETAWGGGVNCTGLCADDHINLKTDSAGKIYVAAKTSFTADTDPFIVLLVRATNGTWTSATESTHLNTNTRGIVLLDETHNRLYLFVSSSEAGGNIVYKSTSMSSPSFVTAGQGDIFVDNPTDAHLNNATSTKQNLTTASGMLVLASDDTSHFYAHNYINLSATNAPTILSFTPTAGPTGSSVVITGTNFTGITAVKFNGVAASSFTVNSSTQITATVASSATTGPITVTNSSGTGTSGSSFTVQLPIPTVTSFTPTGAIVGTAVTITGTKFAGITDVAFNGVSAAPNFTVNSTTKITATVPQLASMGKISVSNSGGTASSSTSFKVIPNISSLSPSSGAVGVPITIIGTSFTGTTSVKFSSNKTATFTVASDTQINTSVPTGAVTGTITVTTPGGTATSGTFTVAPPVVVSSFTPASGPVATSVVINGSGFTGATGVGFGGTPATTFTVNSNTKITATAPPGALTGPISVTAPGGTGSSSTNFLVVPVISGFTPPTGGQGTSVTITGTSFTGTTSVKFNGTTASNSVTDDSHIAATVPAGATTGTITVTTPGGTATSSGTFTVQPPPTITSFSPAGGPAGTQVVITGTNFGSPQGTGSVKFNGVVAAPASNWIDTSITVLVPAGATIGPITVTTPNGVGTSSTNFIPAPVISSFAPTSGTSGTQVILTGLNFTGANAVSFNGGVAVTFNVDSDTSIHATVPAPGSTGPISVTTPVGGTGSSATNFTISPTITSVNPTSAPIGNAVTINGTGFGVSQGVSTVKFGTTPAVTINTWGPTSIQATVPSGVSLGSNPIIVTVGGQPSNGFPFSVIPPLGSVVPNITSFTPFEGIVGTTVTLNGDNFTGTTTVTFNGTSVGPGGFTFVNDNQITAVVPAGATTGPISVTNGAGTALTSTFTVSTLIKKMTFEGGLTDPATGADLSTGSIVVDTTGALKDGASAHVLNATSAYVSKAPPMSANDLYVTFYLRLNAVPASIPRIAEIRTGATTPINGTVVGNLNISTGRALRLNSSTSALVGSSSALALNQVYRVLLHQKTGTGANGLLEAFVALGEDPFPASPFASTTTGTWTAPATVLNMGNTSGTAATDITFDNVQIDSANPPGAAAPLINSLTPNNGHVGDTITISGLNFGASQNASTSVKFGPTVALAGDILTWSDTSITVKVPTGATSGNVVVTNNNNVASNGVPFTVNGVTITSINPTSGAIGATITVNGTGLIRLRQPRSTEPRQR